MLDQQRVLAIQMYDVRRVDGADRGIASPLLWVIATALSRQEGSVRYNNERVLLADILLFHWSHTHGAPPVVLNGGEDASHICCVVAHGRFVHVTGGTVSDLLAGLNTFHIALADKFPLFFGQCQCSAHAIAHQHAAAGIRSSFVQSTLALGVRMSCTHQDHYQECHQDSHFSLWVG